MEAGSWCDLTRQAVEQERNAQRRQAVFVKSKEDFQYISSSFLMASQFWNQADVAEHVDRCLALRNQVLEEAKKLEEEDDGEVKMRIDDNPPLRHHQSRIMDYFQKSDNSTTTKPLHFEYTEKNRHYQGKRVRQFEEEHEKWMRRARNRVDVDDFDMRHWM